MLVAVEYAYFSGALENANGEQIAWFAVLSPLAIPLYLFISAGALVFLCASLLVRNMAWKSVLLVIAIAMQIAFWPGSSECFGSTQECETSLTTYRNLVIVFWIVGGVFQVVFLVRWINKTVERDPYVQRIRQHNDELKDGRKRD